MDRLTRMASALLRWSVRRVPERRRDWVAAVLAEADEVPVGRRRLSWVMGGVRLVLRETRVVRTVGYGLAAAAAGTGAVIWGWHGGSTNPAVPIDRGGTIATVLMLMVLPWVARRRGMFGPGGEDRITRAVRVGGYLAMWALVLTMAGLSRYAGARFDDADFSDRPGVITGDLVGSLLTLGLLTAYTGGILFTTSRRSAIAPRTLAAGAGCGLLAGLVVYGLTPFGNALRITNTWVAVPYALTLLFALLGTPLLAGWLAHRGPPVHADPEIDGDLRTRRGIVAGLWAAGLGALVTSVCTVCTMVLLPHHVQLLWANPDVNAPHGTTFEWQMTVGDTAGKYLFMLILAPILGAIGGGIGGGIGGSARYGGPVATEPGGQGHA